MKSDKLHGDRYRSELTVNAPQAAKGIQVTVSVNQANGLIFWGWGWSCTPPWSHSATSFTCTSSSESLHPLHLVVKFHPHAQAPRLSASVGAPGNDDPNPNNNTASLDL